jgi:hypothetical protein
MLTAGALIVLSLVASQVSALECYKEPFPIVMGGASGNSVFNVLDVYPTNGDIVAAGNTEDLVVKGGCSRTYESPLIVFYSGVTLKMTWGRVIDVAGMSFNGVAFSADGLSIAAHTYNFLGMLDMILIY